METVALGRNRVRSGLVVNQALKPCNLEALLHNNKGDWPLGAGFAQRWIGALGSPGKILSTQPCVVESTSTSIFGKHKTICC